MGGEPGESLDDGRVQLMRSSAEAGEIQNRSWNTCLAIQVEMVAEGGRARELSYWRAGAV